MSGRGLWTEVQDELFVEWGLNSDLVQFAEELCVLRL